MLGQFVDRLKGIKEAFANPVKNAKSKFNSSKFNSFLQSDDDVAGPGVATDPQVANMPTRKPLPLPTDPAQVASQPVTPTNVPARSPMGLQEQSQLANQQLVDAQNMSTTNKNSRAESFWKELRASGGQAFKQPIRNWNDLAYAAGQTIGGGAAGAVDPTLDELRAKEAAIQKATVNKSRIGDLLEQEAKTGKIQAEGREIAAKPGTEMAKIAAGKDKEIQAGIEERFKRGAHSQQDKAEYQRITGLPLGDYAGDPSLVDEVDIGGTKFRRDQASGDYKPVTSLPVDEGKVIVPGTGMTAAQIAEFNQKNEQLEYKTDNDYNQALQEYQTKEGQRQEQLKEYNNTLGNYDARINDLRDLMLKQPEKDADGNQNSTRIALDLQLKELTKDKDRFVKEGSVLQSPLAAPKKPTKTLTNVGQSVVSDKDHDDAFVEKMAQKLGKKPQEIISEIISRKGRYTGTKYQQ